MDTLADRIAQLPPEKRALLELKLARTNAAGRTVEQGIRRRTTGDSAPLSFAQERLWFLDQLEQDSSFYNLARCLSLEGVLDVEALKKALTRILDRHETLRTTIRVANGNPCQIVGQSKPFPLHVIDLSKSPAHERDDDIQERLSRVLNAEITRPFDLSRDLMVRATLVHLGGARHALLLVTHHIASDAWSAAVLLQELSTLYATISRGEPESLPELPIQYADFVLWQRHRLTGILLQKQLSYWKTQLSGMAVLQLPTDRPRPAIQTYRGATQSVTFPRALSDRLEELSRKEGVTLFMTLLAAFHTLLYRYSGQEDITVGSPIAGRVRPETEGLIGMFVNTLVLRTDLSGNPAFRELLGRVRRIALAAYEHQDLPFEKVVEALRPPRDLSRSPLFQVMFAFQNVPRPTFELPDLLVTDIATHTDAATLDLSLYAVMANGCLTTTFEYNTDLFDADTIRRMIGHFETLLRGILTTPDQRISDLPMLADGERNQLLVEWNDTSADHPFCKSIHALFEEQVERSPTAVAVVFEGKQLTYRELNIKANQLASALRNLGVGPDVLVGICVERSLDMVVGLLGVLKAGGAYLPLDPAFPKDRLAFTLHDSQAAVLLTQQSLLPLLATTAHVLCLDSDSADSVLQATNNLDYHGSLDNLANVIYTSGSTGLPKGVQIPHRAVVNLLRSMQRQQRLTERDVLLAVTTLAFDIAGLELFLPLIVGARVVLAGRDVAADPARLMHTLRVSGATVMQATPATWKLLLEAGWQGDTHLRILCGGEALPRQLAGQLLGRCASLWNVYGPTETTIWSTSYKVSATDTAISIGRPIDNTYVYILNADLQPVPVGVLGDLYIGGLGLARGYLHRAELTAEKFIPDSFGDEPGARLYKTGDLARYLPDGNIDLLGRVDHQVKIRGFRIELGECEAVLSRYPQVRQAVVVVREDPSGERILVAYVTTKPGTVFTVAEAIGFLKSTLPDYMVPSAFVVLNELPLTPNGKVDRRALPMPDSGRRTPEEGFVAARNHLEREVANIWQEVLGIQPVGVKDNFFDLGGYSFLAVRVMSRIETVFGKKLPVTALFQMPTVEQLGQLLRQEVSLPPWHSLAPLQPNGSKVPFFWVHGESSDALLSRYLGKDQPLYGLLHQTHDGTPARYTSVEDIASHYLSEIRTVQANGPYFIGGYCFGGLLAFEMAQQLKRRGEQVGLLVLLAPSNLRSNQLSDRAPEDVHTFSSMRTSLRRKWTRYRLNEERLSRREWRLRVFKLARGKMVESLVRITAPVRKLAETAACKAYLKAGLLLPLGLRSPYILKVYFRAIRDYVPEVYSGRVIIFKGPPRWRTLVGTSVEIREVPGSHSDVLKEPYVRVWAEGLKSSLQEAQSSASGRQALRAPQ